jgi:hypothetical protein
MHTIDEIIADAQSAIAASLRQAYDAGRHQQTTEMREKFVAFFEGVIAPFSDAPAAAPAPAEKPPVPAEEPAAEAAPIATTAEAAPAEPASAA